MGSSVPRLPLTQATLCPSSVAGRAGTSLQGVTTYVSVFPDSSVRKESACNAVDLGSIPGSGRSLGEGNGNPLQCSCLETPTDRGAWRATVHGVGKVRHDLETKPPPRVSRACTALLLFRGREAACGRDENGPAMAPTVKGSMRSRVAQMVSHYLLL